jgi:hypothetical protein
MSSETRGCTRTPPDARSGTACRAGARNRRPPTAPRVAKLLFDEPGSPSPSPSPAARTRNVFEVVAHDDIQRARRGVPRPVGVGRPAHSAGDSSAGPHPRMRRFTPKSFRCAPVAGKNCQGSPPGGGKFRRRFRVLFLGAVMPAACSTQAPNVGRTCSMRSRRHRAPPHPPGQPIPF